MTAEVDGLMRVFHSLTYTEQDEAIARINAYLKGDQATKERIVKESSWNEEAYSGRGQTGSI